MINSWDASPVILRCLVIVWLAAGFVQADDVSDYREWHEKCLASGDSKVIDGYIAKFQAMLYYAWRTFDEEGHKEEAANAKAHCHQLDPASWYGKEAGK